jgi:hypothetical protein
MQLPVGEHFASATGASPASSSPVYKTLNIAFQKAICA